MADSPSEPSRPSPLTPDDRARHRGRIGLAIPWEHMPWWVILIVIFSIWVGLTVFSSPAYRDALSFIFDLPWTYTTVSTLRPTAIGDDGGWSYSFKPLDSHRYTFYARYSNIAGETVGEGEVYKVRVADDATATQEPPLQPSQEYVEIQTTTPTIVGVAPPDAVKVEIIDDFVTQPVRVASTIWNSDGFVLTIKATFAAFFFALILGLVFGIMRVSNGSPDLREGLLRRILIGLGVVVLMLLFFPPLRTIAGVVTILAGVSVVMFLLPALPYTISTLYVEIVRGIPMLVIVLYMGFAVAPAIRDATGGRVNLSGLPAGVIGLAIGYGAYLAEVFRAGIEAIPRGQMEAARAVGMNYAQSMRFVILPQAVRLILPPLGNDFIAMLKDSALISVVALPEILQQGRLWISRNFRAFEGFNTVMLVYLVTTLLLSILVRYIERRSRLPGR